jgi:nitrite reductase (NADH) large subunit
LGDSVDYEDGQEIVLCDAAAGVYKRLMIKDNRIIGAVLFGETSDGAWFNDLKNKELDISEIRDTLIFGPAYQGAPPWTLWRPLQPCRMMQKTPAAKARSPAALSRRN